MIYFFSIIIGLGVGIFWHLSQAKNQMKNADDLGDKIISDAKTSITKEKNEFQKKIQEKKESFEQALKDERKRSEERIAAIEKREKFIEQREESAQKKREESQKEFDAYQKNLTDFQASKNQALEALLKKVGFSHEKAKEELEKEYERIMNLDREKRITYYIDYISDTVDEVAKEMTTGILQQYTQRNAQKMHFDLIPCKKDMWEKQRENLALIEKISEVEFEYHEEDQGIFVSHFNLVRRAIAHEALFFILKKKLFDEKNIKFELKKASDKIHAEMMQRGRDAFKVVGIPEGKYPDELVKLTGRMYFRTSYGQNVLEHSIEVAFFAGMFAARLGLDIQTAKEGGLFHDIGKAIDQETEGSHDLLSKQILEEYGATWEVTHAAWTHHDAIPMETLEARVVQAADALSATRPGARAESGQQVAERISMLETKAYAVKGVMKAYALSAGRELRTIFDPEKIDDAHMTEAIKELAMNIEQEGGYPGKVMVHGVRELKIVEKTR